MSRRNFDEWFATFRDTIHGFGYYTDFEKVYRNAAKLRTEIFILNSLVGVDDVEAEFMKLITEYPQCLKAVPMLLAVRKYEISCQDGTSMLSYRFNKMTNTPEEYAYFMRRTGLFDMLQNHIIANLFDYITGVEVGLDSHGRKDRGGDNMEALVESFLKEYGVTYSSQVTNKRLAQDFGQILPPDFEQVKRWDFVIKNPQQLFAIETNFYASTGSKPTETARSYRLLAEHAKDIPGFTFIWITDGKGWHPAVSVLRETFNVLDTLYNIADLEHGKLHSLLVKQPDK